MAKVIILGDIHEPYSRKGYREFCCRTRDKYRCDTVVCIGDEVDSSAISFHQREPEGLSALDEWRRAMKALQKWCKSFPDVKVCWGNHTLRIARVAASVGIPEQFLKTMPQLYNLPSWRWKFEWLIDDVTYIHGTGFGGQHPHAVAAQRLGKSVVLGHCHSRAGIYWTATQASRYFGMSVGCGVDDTALAFRYCQDRYARSMVGCGVVLDGLPTWVPMKL